MVRFISDSVEKKKKVTKNTSRRKAIVDSQAHHEEEPPYSPSKTGRGKKKKTEKVAGSSSKSVKIKEKKASSPDKAAQKKPRRTEDQDKRQKKQHSQKTRQKTPKKKSPEKEPIQNQPGQQQVPSKGNDKTRKQSSPATPRRHTDKTPNKESRKKKPVTDKTPPASNWKLADFAVLKKEGSVRFHDLEIPDPIMHAIADLQFEYCTPIQAQALPPALKGQDVSGRAQTGTGKTAAFLITIFTRLLNHPLTTTLRKSTPRALVIAPTRELAKQIGKEALQIAAHTGLNIIPIYGGKEYVKQKNLLAEGAVDLVIATPGRLLDLKRRHDIHLSHVEIMVIDEADRMLDMGFIPSVRQIINSTPPRAKRQTLLFSATLTPDIIRLAGQWMKDPVTVEIEPEQVAAENIDQRVYIVTNKEKFSLLYNLLQQEKPERALIFVNRRDTADQLMKMLNSYKIPCSVLSGALPQNKRERTLEAFRNNSIKVLVATDVAGRGLHVDGVSHVFNYNIPVDAEDYVHRIGRTGRAGSLGVSISFACDDESFYIPDIEAYLGRELVCLHPEAEWLAAPPPLPQDVSGKKPELKPHRRHRPPAKKRRSR